VPKTDLLQGTLDLLILKILALGPNHGWGIANPVLDPDALKHGAGMVLKVVAIPNDRIRIDQSAIHVNDVQVTGFSPDFVARVVRAPERAPQVVPEGHYFVMGE
jgi:hypothetical protein